MKNQCKHTEESVARVKYFQPVAISFPHAVLALLLATAALLVMHGVVNNLQLN